MLVSKRKSFVKMMKAVNANDIATLQQMADSGFIPANFIVAAKNTNDRKDIYELMINNVKLTRLNYGEPHINIVEQTDGGVITKAIDKFTDLNIYFQGKLHTDIKVESQFEENCLRASSDVSLALDVFLNDVYNRLSGFVKGNHTNIPKSGLEAILMRLNNIENICKHIITQDDIVLSKAGPIATASIESDIGESVNFDTITSLLNEINFEGYQYEDVYPLYKQTIDRITEVHKTVFDYYIMETVSDSTAKQLEIYMSDIVGYGEDAQDFAVSYSENEIQTSKFLEMVCGLYR